MNKRKTLILIVYAPALVGKDRRALMSVHGMEQALSGLRLDWRVTEKRRLVSLLQRDAWLVESIGDGGFPLLCNGNESYPVTVSGRGKSGLFSPGGQDQFEVYAELPLDELVIESAAAVLEGVAEGARAFWGEATPDDAALDIVYQTASTRGRPPSPRRGLPALKRLEGVEVGQSGEAPEHEINHAELNERFGRRLMALVVF